LKDEQFVHKLCASVKKSTAVGDKAQIRHRLVGKTGPADLIGAVDKAHANLMQLIYLQVYWG